MQGGAGPGGGQQALCRKGDNGLKPSRAENGEGRETSSCVGGPGGQPQDKGIEEGMSLTSGHVPHP